MNKKLLNYYIEQFMPDCRSAELKKGQENRLKPLIGKLNNKEGVYKDLPFDLLPMIEQAKLLNYLLNICPERQIVSNMTKIDVDRQLDSFIFIDDVEKETNFCISTFLQDQIQYRPWNIRVEINKNRELIRDYSLSDDIVIQILQEMNEAIIKSFYIDKVYFQQCGIQLSSVDINCVEDYIDYSTDSILRFLIYRILLVDSKKYDKKEVFENLTDKLDELLKLTDSQLNKKRVCQGLSKILNAEELTEYFSIYRGHYNRYYEALNIQKDLSNEIKNNSEVFLPVSKGNEVTRSLLTEEKIEASKNIITEGIPVHEYTRKIKETRSIIDIMNQSHGIQCNPNCLQDIKVYFREIYLSKSRHKGKQTRSIIRDYLQNNKMNNSDSFGKTSQYMFFREKISRGYFREKGLLDLYISKVSIHEKIYSLLLKTYLFYDFWDAMDYIYEINYGIINILKTETSSGKEKK